MILDLLQQIQNQLKTEPVIPKDQMVEIEQGLKRLLHKIASYSQEQECNDALASTPKRETGGIIYIWSDGACSGNPGPGGWGTIIKTDGVKEELSGRSSPTTNNIMELTGALEGIRHTSEGSKIILISDSQYLVKGMNEWIKGWKKRDWKKADGNPVLNREIWIELDRETEKRIIEWQWVKGHAGHPENERCDELARNVI